MNATTRGAIRSKLMWLGLITTVLGALQANAQAIAPFIPEKYFGLANMLVGVAIMVARFLTTETLADKGTPADGSQDSGA